VKLAASGVILDADGRVLLCRRADTGQWNLPGGGLEAGESPWEAAAREVKEETCLDVAVRTLAGVYYIRHVDLMVFSFQCVIVGGEAGPTEESTEISWFFSDSLPQDILPRHPERIRDAIAGGSCVLREQM
jgi:8-oxo-dGTP diphosphatase